MKLKSVGNLISAVFTAAMGVLFIVKKTEVINIALLVFGVMMLVQAVLHVITGNLFACVVKGVVGVAIVVFGAADVVIKLGTIVLGVALLIYGALRLIDWFRGIASRKSTAAKIVELILPAICVFIGASLLMGTFGAIANVMFIVAGVFLVIHGALDLIDVFAAK